MLHAHTSKLTKIFMTGLLIPLLLAGGGGKAQAAIQVPLRQTIEATAEATTQTPLSSDAAQMLAAAPSLVYSSYVGGESTDYGKAVAVDPQGNIYVLGETFSERLLGQDTPISGYSDLFIAKFDPSGSELLYLKLIGSQDTDSAISMVVDSQSNVYVTAYVSDETFPTKNALWPTQPEESDGVLFKLDSQGEVVYSTYLPFDVFYSRQNVAVDGAGNAYVTGSYWDYEPDEEGNYLASQIALLKFSPDGKNLLLERYYGEQGTDRGVALTLDGSGNIYITGTIEQKNDFPVTANALQPECGDIIADPDTYCYKDGIVMVLNAAGEIIYASYHGGSFTDDPQAIATDGKGNILITGNTSSGEFPIKGAIVDSCPLNPDFNDCWTSQGFASVFQLKGGKATLLYSTYLGSKERSSTHVVFAATMDSTGNAYITGYTNGKHFPTQDALQDELYESFCYTFSSERYCFDAFLSKIDLTGKLVFGTYLGAAYDEYPYGVALGPDNAIYVAGTTEADDFPVTDDAMQPDDLVNDDGFLIKLGTSTVTPPPPPGDPNDPNDPADPNDPNDPSDPVNPVGSQRLLLPALLH